MGTINLEQIDKINEQLDGIINYLDESCAMLQDIVDAAGNEAQAAVDEAAEEISEKINEQLAKIRQKIIDIFKAQYEKATEKIEPIKAILDALPISADLGAIVDMLKLIVEVITAPYQPIMQFITEIIPKVLELSNKLQTIASYRPTIPDIPNIEMPTLNISVEPISPSDITG